MSVSAIDKLFYPQNYSQWNYLLYKIISYATIFLLKFIFTHNSSLGLDDVKLFKCILSRDPIPP